MGRKKSTRVPRCPQLRWLEASGTVIRNNEDRDEHVRGRERGHVSHYFS